MWWREVGLINKYEVRAEVLKAVAHPARLKIIDTLTESGPKCVSELTEMLDLSQPTVSGHLAVLRSAGIVANEKQGLQVVYHIRTPCIARLFGCLDAFLQEDLQKRQEELKKELGE